MSNLILVRKARWNNLVREYINFQYKLKSPKETFGSLGLSLSEIQQAYHRHTGYSAQYNTKEKY